MYKHTDDGLYKYTDDEARLEDLLCDADSYFQRPAVAYQKLAKARERYDRAYTRATRTGVDYSSAGKLGVRVQTSTRNGFEDGLVDLCDCEYAVKYYDLLYRCEWITLMHSMRLAGLSDIAQKVIIRRIRPWQMSFDKIAKDLGLKSKQQANYIHRTGLSQFVVGFIERMNIYHDHSQDVE